VDPAVRLLRLLSLLPARPSWPGPELAERLGVTARTVRRDVARLRQLGYPIHAVAGLDGGYELGAGGRLPPLLLDDDEVVAIALGLRLATTATVTGVEESTVAALAKLNQVLPPRLAERVQALHQSTMQLVGGAQPQIDAETLTVLATGCRRTEGIRFEYVNHSGATTARSVEPHRIVHSRGRWYLVARDRDRQDWRTFRVDRITAPRLTGQRYRLTDIPDAAALIAESTTLAPYKIEAQIRCEISPERARRRFGQLAVVEPRPDGRVLLRVAANDLDLLVSHITGLEFDFEVLGPPEVRAAVADRAARIAYQHGK
jgi:predicted DNA-binding transcriptional regulator YafY